METKTLLNVDHYRSILMDDPSIFLNFEEKNGFEAALRNEVSELKREIEDRLLSAEPKNRVLLTAKVLDALGYKDGAIEWVKIEFPNFEDRHDYVSNAEDQLARNSRLMNITILQNPPSYLPFPDLEPNRNEIEKLCEICSVMNMHKRLVAVIADTPILNAGLNLEKPKQPQAMPSDIPLFGLHEPPAADNNINSPTPQQKVDRLFNMRDVDGSFSYVCKICYSIGNEACWKTTHYELHEEETRRFREIFGLEEVQEEEDEE